MTVPPVIRRTCLGLPFLLLTGGTAPLSACGGDATGPNCKIGCSCGASCIDCSKTCHKTADYYWTGIVPDSLKPKS